MATVSKEIADTLIARNGLYPGDEHIPPVVRIVEYTNQGGQKAYGILYEHEAERGLWGKYMEESPYMSDQKEIWRHPKYR